MTVHSILFMRRQTCTLPTSENESAYQSPSSMVVSSDATIHSLVTCRGFTVLVPKIHWFFWNKSYTQMSLFIKIMKTQCLQNIAECNRLLQGSEIVSSISHSVHVTYCKWTISRPFCLQFRCWKESKSTSTLHLQYKHIHKISPSCCFHWETTSDSGTFCKPSAQAQSIFRVTLARGCLEFSGLSTALTKAVLWGTCLENLCARSVDVARTVGKRMLSHCLRGSDRSTLKTKALFLIVLEYANSYLPQTVFTMKLLSCVEML